LTGSVLSLVQIVLPLVQSVKASFSVLHLVPAAEPSSQALTWASVRSGSPEHALLHLLRAGAVGVEASLVDAGGSTVDVDEQAKAPARTRVGAARKYDASEPPKLFG
jgi:hypothetical protein